jgi:predicted ABC-type exoprotein transport system permease subunit
MEDKELDKFSWTAFFLVTGFCSFSFSKIFYYLDGSQLPIFTWIGVISFLTGMLNSFRTLIMKTDSE